MGGQKPGGGGARPPRVGDGQRPLRDNERALLALIKQASPGIHPALKPLLDRVG